MKKKLLIADDDGDICALLKTVFEDKFEVDKVKNGKELIEKAVKEKPDLIITDVVMPSVSGYRAVKKLSGEPGFDNSAVIFTSGAIPDRDLYEMHKPKNMVSAFIPKPFNVAAVIKLADELLDKKGKNNK